MSRHHNSTRERGAAPGEPGAIPFGSLALRSIQATRIINRPRGGLQSGLQRWTCHRSDTRPRLCVGLRLQFTALLLTLLLTVRIQAQGITVPPPVPNPVPTHHDLPSDFDTRFQQFDNLQAAFIKRLFKLNEEQTFKLTGVLDKHDVVVNETLASMAAEKLLPPMLSRMTFSDYINLSRRYTARRIEMFAEVLTPADRQEYLRQSQAREAFAVQANAEAITVRLDEKLWLTAAQRESMHKSMAAYPMPLAFNLLLHLLFDSIPPHIPPLGSVELELTQSQRTLAAYLRGSAVHDSTPATYLTVANAQGIIPIPGQRYQPDEQLAPVIKVIGEISDPPTFVGQKTDPARQKAGFLPQQDVLELMRRIELQRKLQNPQRAIDVFPRDKR